MLIDFELPERLIAMHPSQKRDHCRMLVFDRKTGQTHHTTFNQLPTFLDDSYFLVLNQARVNPSRMFWLDPKGKKQEILFMKHVKDLPQASQWEAIVSGKNLKAYHPYVITDGLEFMLLKDRENSLASVQVNKTKSDLEAVFAEKGQLPLPPYILKRRADEGEANYIPEDETAYQTVFSKKSGAAAAPTAGLHFTDQTFEEFREKKIDWDFVHLSVGWGTFETLSQKHFDEKKLHPEYCEITPESAKRILAAKKAGKKILAIGTTSMRTLESWGQQGMSEQGFEKDTELFVIPPYDFKVADAMLTNFHIPKSSLLLLVAAFLGDHGVEKVVSLYQEAISMGYQFYSYGDCMLIL